MRIGDRRSALKRYPRQPVRGVGRALWRALPVAGRLCALALCLSCANQPSPEPALAPTTSEGVGPIVERGESAYERGDLDTAIAAYSEALERTPWNDRLKRLLASTYTERAERARAEQRFEGVVRAEGDLRSALALYPEDPLLRRNLAVVLVDRSTRTFDPEESARFLGEARVLDPEVAAGAPVLDLEVERRLDLAYQLLERGQLEAGLFRLERLHEQHPDRADVARLLGAALVRKGLRLEQSGDHRGAGGLFDRAVANYAGTSACAEGSCDDPEIRLAHRNRIVAWVHASRPDSAREALADAERIGLRFPELQEAVAELAGGQP